MSELAARIERLLERAKSKSTGIILDISTMEAILVAIRTEARLRTALEKIAFVTGGLDTPATSNAAHYEATAALTYQQTAPRSDE